MQCPRNLIFIILLIVYPDLTPAAEKEEPLVMRRLNGMIEFDGIPDENAWLEAEPFPMVTHQPVFGKEPREHTDIRILFDDDFIYVGAALYTKEASTIQSNSKRRDEMKADNDWVGVIFDSYNDNENGLAFWTTPAGLRTDIAVFNDAAGDRIVPVNSSWNTFWDVKSVINEEGWFTEIRIPVSSLKFQERNDEAVMGLIIVRYLPHRNELYIFPAIPNEYGPWSAWKVSLGRDVVFPGLKSKKPLYITPYGLAGFSQLNELNESESDYEFSRDNKLNAGLDVKYGITSNITLDLTLNTDFAQVEADDEQVNLTRFDLYFEEKRQFFLERASIFDFHTGGTSTMFYSRRIGLDDDGNIVPIIGGVRLIGRTGGFDLGLMNMQTAGSDSLPSENFGVVRFKNRILNENSYAGGIYTSRLGIDGGFNQVYGVDGLIRVVGDEFLGYSWGQSFENGLANKPFSFANARYRLSWERRKNVGLHYEFFLSGTGYDYNPGIGFQSRYDYHMAGIVVNYLWLAPEASPILRHGPMSRFYNYYNMSRGLHETGRYHLDYLLELKTNWMFSLGVNYWTENLFEEFELSEDAIIPTGYYEYRNLMGFVSTPATRPVWLLLEGTGGGYYDGSMINLMFMPNWSISSTLALSGSYVYSNLRFPERDQHYISHIARLKALVMFTTRLSLSAFIQYNSDERMVGSNIRFRYNPREGNDLWLVFNEGTHTDLKEDIPYRPRLSGRTVMLKYTYTFRL
jgi:hypothetical protein